MNLPNHKQCEQILAEYHTPQHIIKHSQQVNKVANFLACELTQAGESIDQELVDRASLLHDVLRVVDVKGDLFKYTEPEDETEDNKKIWKQQQVKYKELHHAEAAFEIFKDDYPEMAEVIKIHRNSGIITDPLDSWEKKVMHYSDKRVDHYKTVSLDDRMKLGLQRWQVKPENDHSEMLLVKMKALEKIIFDKINKSPEIINEL